MITITYDPSVSETYKRLREGLDGRVYDVTDAALARFPEVVVLGSGVNAGSFVEIHEDILEETLAYVQSDSYGAFKFSFTPIKDKAYVIRAMEVGTTNESNSLALRQYDLHSLLYEFSRETLNEIEDVGQLKQDIYIYPRVGDTLDPRFPTEVDSYNSTIEALRDKITFPQIPMSYFDAAKSKEDMVQASMEISELGGVYGSLFKFDELFSGIGVESVFVDLGEKFWWWDINERIIPYISGIDEITIPSLRKKQYWWGYRYIASDVPKTVDFSGALASGVNYAWAYIDGDNDLDGTLTVKTSITQPLPINTTLTDFVQAIDVQQDDDEGNVTGIPYQLYIELDVPAISTNVEDTINWVREGVTDLDLDRVTLVSREILALGQCNIDNDITVSYKAYYEPFIICGVRFKNGEIDYIHRTFNFPNSGIRVWDWDDLNAVYIYVKFKDWRYITSRQVDAIRSVLHAILPVTSQFLFLVSYLPEDEMVPEGSVSWTAFFKSYAIAESVQPPISQILFLGMQNMSVL